MEELDALYENKDKYMDLFDIQDLEIDMDLPVEERFKAYIDQLGNPYCMKYDDIKIMVNYNEEGDALQDIMTEYFSENK